MVRRALWLSAGMAVGAASSFSVMRRVRRQMARYAPERLGADLAQAARRLRDDVRAAASEGRVAMAEREAQLWAELDPKRPLRTSR